MGGHTIYEFSYASIGGGHINEAIDPTFIANMREQYGKNTVAMAYEIADWLTARNYMASVLTFMCVQGINEEILLVRDELNNNEIKEYYTHSIVWLGDCVIDAANSNRIILTPEYIKRIKELNVGFEVLLMPQDSYVFDENYNRVTPTLRWLIDYRAYNEVQYG